MEQSLYVLGVLLLIWLAFTVGKYIGGRTKEGEVRQERKDAVQRSRSVLTGQFSEQLAPYLPDFPFSPTECRFIGKPIDLIVFKGADEKNINEVIFVEIKSGNSKLSTVERRLRDAIQSKQVSWLEYRVPTLESDDIDNPDSP